MLNEFRFLDYFILILLLLKGLLGKNSQYDSTDGNYLGNIESDYLKIFSDIKDIRSKAPDYYNTEVTFEPEKASLLLKDPVTYKRTSISSPPMDDVGDFSTQNERTIQNDRLSTSRDMDFQKRQDDPLHRKHGVGEGLAALPTTIKGSDEKIASVLKYYENGNEINEEGKTKIYGTDSLGMVREKIDKPVATNEKNESTNVSLDQSKEVNTIKNDSDKSANVSLDQSKEYNTIKDESKSRNNDTQQIPDILLQALTNLAGKTDNDSSTGQDKNTSSLHPIVSSENVNTTSIADQKSNSTGDASEKHSNSTDTISSKNVTTRNMIYDAGIKGFLAKIDSFTMDDVGKNKPALFNDTSFPEKKSSNLASISNMTSAEGNSSESVSRNSSLNNNSTIDESISYLKSVTNTTSNETSSNHSESDNTPTRSADSHSELNNTSVHSKTGNETIASKLEQMLGNEPKTNSSVESNVTANPDDKKGSTTLVDIKGTAKTLIQRRVHHFYAPLHLSSVTDEMRGHLNALDVSPFKGLQVGEKKDNIKVAFQPECRPDKPCPPNKYCRHFECFDCHNKHHECIADEQCCDKMPCIYGRCDKKAKKSPGAICKNDGDCSDGCCVLEPTINIETGICKIKLAEFHQCSPVLYRKVWIGDKKPNCGPCEDGLECTNKGVVATHLVCMKKKG